MSLYSHVFARVYDPFLALGERSGMRDLRRNPGRRASDGYWRSAPAPG